MNTAFIMAFGAGVANAGVAVASKAAERNACRVAPYAALTLAIASLTTASAAIVMHGTWMDWRLWAIGGILGVLYLGAIASMLYANSLWPPSLVWSTANMAFLLPILCSAVLLGEALRWIDVLIVAGILAMLLGLMMPMPRQETVGRNTAVRWLILGGVFLSNGLLMFGFKLFDKLAPGTSSACFSAIMYGSGSLLAWIWYLGSRQTAITRSEVRFGVATGVGIGTAMLTLMQAMHLPAAVAFPIIQGISLAGGVALCACIFREPWPLRKTGALLTGIVALLLTAIR